MKQNSGGPLRAIGRLKINFWIALLLCILCVGVTYGVASSRSRAAFGSEENYAQAMKYLEIKNTIDDYYIGEVDEETISSAAFSAMEPSSVMVYHTSTTGQISPENSTGSWITGKWASTVANSRSAPAATITTTIMSITMTMRAAAATITIITTTRDIIMQMRSSQAGGARRSTPTQRSRLLIS